MVHEFILSKHAKEVIARRGIDTEWISYALSFYVLKDTDPQDPTLTRFYVEIKQRENRVLRVCVNCNKNPWIIVSAHFDRNKKGRL